MLFLIVCLVLQLLVPSQLVQSVLNSRKFSVILFLERWFIIVVNLGHLPFLYLFHFFGWIVRQTDWQRKFGCTLLMPLCHLNTESFPQLFLNHCCFLQLYFNFFFWFHSLLNELLFFPCNLWIEFDIVLPVLPFRSYFLKNSLALLREEFFKPFFRNEAIFSFHFLYS